MNSDKETSSLLFESVCLYLNSKCLTYLETSNPLTCEAATFQKYNILYIHTRYAINRDREKVQTETVAPLCC